MLSTIIARDRDEDHWVLAVSGTVRMSNMNQCRIRVLEGIGRQSYLKLFPSEKSSTLHNVDYRRFGLLYLCCLFGDDWFIIILLFRYGCQLKQRC